MFAKHVNDQTFHSEVLESSIPVLIDFWAPWCGPCRVMGPVVDELAQELGDAVKVVKIDVDQARETAVKYGIQSIPTFLVIADGQVRQRITGAVPKSKLLDAVQTPSR